MTLMDDDVSIRDSSTGGHSQALEVQARRDQLRRNIEIGMDLSIVPVAEPTRALAIPSDGLSQTLLSVARSVGMYRAGKRQEREQDGGTVAEYLSRSGVAHRNDIALRIPSLARHSLGFQGLPCGAFATMVSWAPPTESEAPRVLALRGRPEFGKAFQDMMQEWARRHRVIQHGLSTPLPRAPASDSRQKPTCLEASFCLCGETGDAVWSFFVWLRRSMKTAMRGAAAAKLLQEGFVVLNISPLTQDDFDLMQSGDVGDFGEETLDDSGFVHVSLLYESPFRPTFRSTHRFGGTSDIHSQGSQRLGDGHRLGVFTIVSLCPHSALPTYMFWPQQTC